jgi:hypothetical protein
MVARFYSFQDSEIRRMDFDRFEEYYENIKIISAQEQLRRFQASAYPHMKDSDEVHKKVYMEAYPSNLVQRAKVTLSEIARRIGIIKQQGS